MTTLLQPPLALIVFQPQAIESLSWKYSLASVYWAGDHSLIDPKPGFCPSQLNWPLPGILTLFAHPLLKAVKTMWLPVHVQIKAEDPSHAGPTVHGGWRRGIVDRVPW